MVRKESFNLLLKVTLFGISMSYVESAVVVYLRELYYPDGFNFPLKFLPFQFALTEILREAATIIMLFSVALIATKNKNERWAFFIYAFGVWDIFYYLFLKFLINWPESFFTLDILFLIPVPWVGPVIAPVIVSFSMMIFAFILIQFNEKRKFKLKPFEIFLIVFSIVLVLFSFIHDYIFQMLSKQGETDIWSFFHPEKLMVNLEEYIPQKFLWIPFLAGIFLFYVLIFLVWKRMKLSGS